MYIFGDSATALSENNITEEPIHTTQVPIDPHIAKSLGYS